MMGFRWGLGERWYYWAQGLELQFPGATNAKSYLRDEVVLQTYSPNQVVLTQNVEMEPAGLRDSEVDFNLGLSDM